MALVKGYNSYVTVEEADAHFADRLDVAAWHEASATEKPQALVTATYILDCKDWVGVAVSESQDTAFPRIGSYFDPRVGSVVTLPSDAPPTRILKATYELAHHLLNNDGLLDDTGSVSSLSFGSVKMDNLRAPSTIPANVRALIQPLLAANTRTALWRAN